MSKKTKTIICAVLTLLYLAALVLLFVDFQLGLVFWAIALVPSLIFFLYMKRLEHQEMMDKLEEEAEKTEE